MMYEYFSETEIENKREDFSIQFNLLSLKLEEMLEKTKKIEAQLVKEISLQINDIDCYKPDPDMRFPPTKRMKIEK